MSRIAKSPVTIPSGVEVTLTSNSITVKSGAGTLVQALHASVEVNQEGEELTFLSTSHCLSPLCASTDFWRLRRSFGHV